MVSQPALNQELATSSYLNGPITATKEDYKVCAEVGTVDASEFPHLARWQKHVNYLAEKFPNFGPRGEAVPDGKKRSAAAAGAADVAAPPAAAAPAPPTAAAPAARKEAATKKTEPVLKKDAPEA